MEIKELIRRARLYGGVMNCWDRYFVSLNIFEDASMRIEYSVPGFDPWESIESVVLDDLVGTDKEIIKKATDKIAVNKKKSNTEFGLFLDNIVREGKYSKSRAYDIRRNFDNFVSKAPALGMFVPCKLVDGVWVVLEQTSIFECHVREYQQAQERVLFEGFEFSTHRDYPKVNNGRLTFIFDEHGCWLEAYDSCDGQRINNIERLTELKLSEEHLQLTKTALKQIGI